MISDLKEQAKRIYSGLMRSIEISEVMNEKVKLEGDSLILSGEVVDLAEFKEIVLIGIGKASVSMASAIEGTLGERIKRGLLVSDSKPRLKVKSDVIVAGHPLPDSNSFMAARRVMELISSCDSETLIIFLISGGGSSLVELPLWDDVTLEDYKQLNKVLTQCGASIREINVVRKHFSRIKGGRLGQLAERSKSVALYVSDVNSGDIQSIASNLLMPDSASLVEFYEVVYEYGLMSSLPASIADRVEQRAIPELPRDRSEGKGDFNLLLLDNHAALKRCAEIARDEGLIVELDTSHEEGNYRLVLDELFDKLLKLAEDNRGARVCLISGGEASCAVHGNGLGGRNQESVLYSAFRMTNLNARIAVLSCGTDGLDGNSNAAGAVADDETLTKARLRGIDASKHLERNDSHSFFKQVGGLITTGPAGNNVRDVRIMLAEKL